MENQNTQEKDTMYYIPLLDSLKVSDVTQTHMNVHSITPSLIFYMYVTYSMIMTLQLNLGNLNFIGSASEGGYPGRGRDRMSQCRCTVEISVMVRL